jgi:hypothetical protein
MAATKQVKTTWNLEDMGGMTTAEKLKKHQAFVKSNSGSGKTPPLIRSADQLPSTYGLRRPSGITQLDIDTGGGLPAGGLSCLSGVDNAGKSTLLYLYCAMQQRIYGADCAISIAHVEGVPDYFHMRNMGFMVSIPEANIRLENKKRQELGKPKFTKEAIAEMRRQVGIVDFVVGFTGEEVMKTVLRSVRSRLYNIVALDSVSVLQSASEAAKPDFEKAPQQAANANLITRFAQRFSAYMAGYEGPNFTTTVFTQQVRASKKKSEAPAHLAKYMPEYEAQGSYALKHLKLLDIALAKGSKEREGGGEGVAGTVVGRTVKYKLIKGKAGTHDEIAGEYDFTYADGYRPLDTLYVQGVRVGAIEETKSSILVHQEGGDRGTPAYAFENREDFVRKLTTDVGLEIGVRTQVMAFAGHTHIYYHE